MPEIDDTDRKLLERLQISGRTSYAELSSALPGKRLA